MAIFKVLLVLLYLSLSATFAKSPCQEAFQNLQALSSSSSLRTFSEFEQSRIENLKPEKDFSQFTPSVGFSVVERDSLGVAQKANFRVLIDRPFAEVFLASDFVGLEPKKFQKLKNNGSFFEGVVDIYNGMEYMIIVDGKALIDPAAPLFTVGEKVPLRSVFWDYGHPRAYKMRFEPIDLRKKAIVIAETEPYHLARFWEVDGKIGPRQVSETYKFIATSGIIEKLKSFGYNAIEFMPVSEHVELSTTTERPGSGWWVLYQSFGLFGPTLRYGTPDDFAAMVDAFNAAGIAVIMDFVASHFPYKGNVGIRELSQIGIHNYVKADGKPLFGFVPTEFGTLRYDYSSPLIRRFLIDGALFMLKNFNISGIRIDNPDGIRQYPFGGGEEFLRELATEVRKYRPEAILIAEEWNEHKNTTMSLDSGGLGYGFRTNYGFFLGAVKGELANQDVNMEAVVRSISESNIEPGQVFFITNHDITGNPEGGATGAYPASLLDYEPHIVSSRLKAWGALSAFSGSAYIDMLQMRLLQKGNLDNPEIEWQNLKRDEVRDFSDFFARLSRIITSEEAFAFKNLSRAGVINHADSINDVISIIRVSNSKKFYAIINLSDRQIQSYRFGVDEGTYSVILDSHNSYESFNFSSNNGSYHDKKGSIIIPKLLPFQVIVFSRDCD